MPSEQPYQHASRSGPFVASQEQINRVGNLSDMQRACVELVSIGSSKIIAQRLGISHHTVDQHLKEACRRLGVSSRIQASATLAAAASSGISSRDLRHPQVWGDPPARVDADAPTVIISPSDRQIDAERERDRVRDAGLVGLEAIPPIVAEQPRFRDSEYAPAGLAHTLKRVLAYALVISILAAASVSIGSGYNAIGNFIEIDIRHH